MKTPQHSLILPGVASIIIVLLAISAYNHRQVLDISQRLQKVVSEHNTLIQHFSRGRQLHHERSYLLQSLAISRDPFEQDELLMQMGTLFSEIISLREQVLQLPLAGNERQLVRQHYFLASEVVNAQREAANQVIDTNYEAATATIKNKVIPLQKVAFSMIEQIIALQNNHNAQALTDTNQQIRTINTITGLLLMCGIVFIIITAFVVRRKIRHEVTQRYETEKQLRNSELRERLIRENIIDSLITIDHNGIIQSCNRATTTIFGYSIEELIGQNINVLIPEPVRSNHDRYIADYLDSGKGQVIGIGREFVALHKNGTNLPIDIEVTETTIDNQRLFIAVIRDITEKKEAETRILSAYNELEQRVKARTMALEQSNKSLSQEIHKREKAQRKLTYLATHDPLTALPNRTAFTEHLEKAIQSARCNQQYAALLYMDLDGFKEVNDTFGHTVGDQLLRAVSQRFKTLIREMDTVARLGGDEFGLVLGDLFDLSAADTVADKLIKALQEPFIIDDKRCQVGVSIGIGRYPLDGEDADTLLSKADDAMYEAKRCGKNTYRVFHPYSTAL